MGLHDPYKEMPDPSRRAILDHLKTHGIEGKRISEAAIEWELRSFTLEDIEFLCKRLRPLEVGKSSFSRAAHALMSSHLTRYGSHQQYTRCVV